MRRIFQFASLCFAAAFVMPSNANDKEKKDADKPKSHSQLIVPPASGDGKTKLDDWRFTTGTRPFSITGDVPMKAKGGAAGSEYLEFREEKSTTYQNGILTLIPVESIRTMDFDRDKKAVSVIVATAGDGADTLIGSTKFLGINRFTIEGESILDGLGAASVKFHGGADKGPRSFAFANAKPVAEAKGPVVDVIATDKVKHSIRELQPLYVVDGAHRALPYLMFKKTVKIDMDRIASLRSVTSDDKKGGSIDYEVTLRDGAKHTLILLTKIELDKGKTATLEGLVGRVPAGYKLFPLHTIQEVQFMRKPDV